MFELILDKTMHAYIDDMVGKTRREPDHVRDLTKVFTILKRHKLRLNVAKCESSRKFLGHLVTRQGIEANSE